MEIPAFGLGTYKLKNGDDTYEIIKQALQLGYRHIDTASLYCNEKSVGRAIKDSGVPREEIFITTKIQRFDIYKGEKKMIKSVEKSFRNLQVDYIDQVLLHAPLEEKIEESWKILEQIYQKNEGKIKHIGISNFNIGHVQRVLKVCQVKPYTNQVECSPFLLRSQLIDFCRTNSIKIVAHSSLTKGEKFDDPIITQMAQNYNTTPASILLLWGAAKGYTIIPRTSNTEHLVENLGCFDSSTDLTCADIETLDSLDSHQFATHPKYID